MGTKTRKHQLAAYQRRCIFQQLNERAVKVLYTRLSLSSIFSFFSTHTRARWFRVRALVSVLAYTYGSSDSLPMKFFFQRFFFSLI